MATEDELKAYVEGFKDGCASYKRDVEDAIAAFTASEAASPGALVERLSALSPAPAAGTGADYDHEHALCHDAYAQGDRAGYARALADVEREYYDPERADSGATLMTVLARLKGKVDGQ